MRGALRLIYNLHGVVSLPSEHLLHHRRHRRRPIAIFARFGCLNSHSSITSTHDLFFTSSSLLHGVNSDVNVCVCVSVYSN